MKKYKCLLIVLLLNTNTFCQKKNDKSLILYLPIKENEPPKDYSFYRHTIVKYPNLSIDSNMHKKLGAFAFNGKNSFIEIKNRQKFSLTTVTICAWIKTKQENGYGRIIVLPVFKGLQVYSLNINVSAKQSDIATGKASIYFDKNDSTGPNSILTSKKITDGKWHQLVGIINSNTKTLKLYLDGKLDR